jgi:hypothetical protein
MIRGCILTDLLVLDSDLIIHTNGHLLVLVLYPTLLDTVFHIIIFVPLSRILSFLQCS